MDIVTENTKFTIEGYHSCGRDMVFFSKTASFNRGLSSNFCVDGKKAVVVGSSWTGPIGCGHSMTVRMKRATYNHVSEGKKIITEKDSTPQMQITFSCFGFGQHVRWSGGQRIAEITS